MSDQFDLFTTGARGRLERPKRDEYPPALYDGTPPHEATDTSREAAERILSPSSALRTAVLASIVDSGTRGMTDDEIEVALTMRHQTASARRRELVLLGKVQDSGGRRQTRSGRAAAVWIATGEGEPCRNREP